MFPELLDFFSKVGATLVGALIAFELEHARRRRADERERISRMKQALFTLVEQRQFILNFKKQVLDPKKDDPIRSFTIHAQNSFQPALKIDVDGLGFLLDADGELLNRLVNADLRFRTLNSLIDVRSAVHLRFQETAEANATQENYDPASGPITVAELEHLVGRVMSKQLQEMTDDLYRCADDALATNRSVFKLVHEHAAGAFPKEKFFRVEELFEVL